LGWGVFEHEVPGCQDHLHKSLSEHLIGGVYRA
jgi:hypothetical protein